MAIEVGAAVGREMEKNVKLSDSSAGMEKLTINHNGNDTGVRC
jgi:hypothetical protein